MKKYIVLLALTVSFAKLHAQGCVSNIALTTAETITPIVHQASNTVSGSVGYGVASGYNSTLLAGNLIVLKPNTHIKSGSLFLAKITNCPSTGKMAEDIPDKITGNFGITAYPNPAQTVLNLTAFDMEISRITLATVDGREVLTKSFKNETSLQLDLSSYPIGVYLLNVETADGKVFKEKILKN